MIISKREYEFILDRVFHLESELLKKDRIIKNLERENDALINIPGRAEAMRDLEAGINAYLNQSD